jgi:hypothetical protein
MEGGGPLLPTHTSSYAFHLLNRSYKVICISEQSAKFNLKRSLNIIGELKRRVVFCYNSDLITVTRIC